MKRNRILFVIAIVAILAVLFVACDDKAQGAEPVHTHTYGAWNLTTDPTESTDGSATRVCACGDSETTTVAKLSDASVWTVTVSQDATHESAGFKAYKSDVYGTVTLTFPKGQHVYGGWEISVAPSEDETGVAIRKCACGHYEEATLAVLTNASVWTKKIEAATHTAPGKVIYTSEYGVVTVLTNVEDHVYGAWTDNHNGTHSRACECGDVDTDNCVYNQKVAAPAFLKSEANCTTKAVYYMSCVCGAHSAEATFESGTANGHDYYNFRVVSEPNCTEGGQVVADCRNCDYQYDGEIPALGHDFSGECVPYVEGSTEGGDEYDEEGGSSDESQYHVHTCTRCDAVDTAHKEAHVFGSAVYTLHLVPGTDNMYEVWAKYSCEKCSYSKTVTNEFNRYIGQDDSWTLVEEVAADYNQAGHATWEFNDGREITVYTDKLVAPYEGTTYYYLEVRTPDSGNEVRVDGYTSVKVTFDENGKATGDTGLFRGDNTIRIVNASTGEITFERNDNGSLYSDSGSIDLVNGVIVRSTYNDWDRAALMVPSDMTVGAQDVSGSFWTDSKALSFNAKCNLNETHTFNVFVYNEQVYFGAQFVDIDGEAVAAKDCADAQYVQVLDAEGNQIQAFAQKNGILKKTDGKEGLYVYEGGNVVLNGVGTAVVNGEVGLYVAAAEGADYDFDVYVGESVESATAYYRLTLGESNACTLAKPMTTFYFKTGVDDIEIDDMQANLNVATTLPTPEREGYVFNGWKLQGEGESVNAFVATSTTDDYTFEAQWSKKTTVVVNGLKEEDKAQYSTVYIGLGNPFVGVLPAYDATTYRDGYKFVGWYLDDGDGVLNTGVDTPLADSDTAEVEGADYVIFAAWVWAGNVEFEKQTKYGWEYVAESNTWRSTNWHVASTTSVMEIKWTSGVVRVEFDYWVDGESGSDYLTVYYYDVNGTRQSIITKSTGNVAKGNAVHVVCILDAEGESLRLSYSKDSGVNNGEDRAFVENLTINGESVVSQTSLNKNAGVYTASDDAQVRVGANGLVTIGENSYAGSVVSDNVIAITVDGVYTEVTLNTADMTCSIVEPKVNVSYNYNGHGENSSVAVGKYSNQTLSTDVPTAEGFIFRGWYTDEAFTTEASATFVASSDVTFYAKWDEAITLTYVYLDGTTANVVVNLFANDQVETLQTVDFKFGDSVFVGWYTKDGTDSGDWGVKFAAGTTLTTNTTVYAQWKTPHALTGDYTYAANLDPTESGIVKETDNLSKGSYSIYVDAEGNITAGNVKGVIKDYNPENGTFYVDSNGTKYYGGYNAETKTIYVDYSSNMSSAYHDIKFAAAQIGDEVPTATFNNAWDNGCTKLVRITYKNGDVESYRYVLIYGKSIYSVTSWNATDAKGNAVTDFEKIYTDANLLTVVYGDNTLAVGRKNNNFVDLDGYQGTYSNGLTAIVLDGVGGITYGTEKGTYTAATDGAGYTFDVKTDSKAYKLTVNKDDKTTYTIEENTVTISFVNDKVAVSDVTAYVGFKQTLTAPAEVEGFVFRGWYGNAEFSGSAVTSFTATENATFYAKYDAAVTVTFDYDGYEYETGKTTLDVTGKYVNDTLGNIIPTVASDVRNNGRAFAGWYFKDGEVWGEQATSSTKLTESVTIYARWIDPPASMGTYETIEVYSVASGKEVTSLSSSNVLTINADGSYSGARVNAGKLSADDAEKANGVINIGKYAYLSDALGGIIVYSYYSGTSYATSIGTDFYIGFRNSANITKVEYSADTLGGGYVAFFTVSYTEDGANKTMNLFVYNEIIYANVMWTDGVTAKAAATTESVLISDAYGKAIVKKSGSAMVGNDGKSGSYTNTDAYGEIVLDGFGTLTVNGKSVAYTLDGNKVTFVAGNAMRVVEIADGTYTKVLDGYQGTYTLPDGSTLELDGYGNIAGTTNTYVVSGGTVEIHEGETSSSYGIDVEGKTLNDKSQFAGLTFSGTYNDSWDEGTDRVSLKFDDASALTGTFTHHGGGYSPAVSAKFTATFDGTKMIVTITECSESSWVGKTIELSYANDTFTVTSFFKSSGQYAVSKNTKLSLQA